NNYSQTVHRTFYNLPHVKYTIQTSKNKPLPNTPYKQYTIFFQTHYTIQLMSNNSSSEAYRNDIDGLRAFAVVLVILFHAGISQVPSGFIGVDIFFAISGFLITGIVIKQYEKNNFSLSDFFIHRLWRIQPAFIAMSLTTLIATFYFYLPDDFLAYLRSGKYNALFLSNQFFARQSATYASPEADIFPLLHTWSLSIEWQWYLFLPLGILLTGAISRLKRLQSIITNPAKMLSMVWFITTPLATVLALILANKGGNTYYSLITRIFEFMVGGGAFFLTRYVHYIPSSLSHVAGILSLAVLLWIAVHPDIMGFYPNLYALLVVCSSAIIMFAGSYGKGITSRILGLPPIAFTGRISYSLYLWHWPILAITRYLGYDLTGTTLFLCLFLTVLISLISYYLVEQPCRRYRKPLKYTVPLLIIAPIVIFCTELTYAEHRGGIPARFGSEYVRVSQNINAGLTLAGSRPDCLDGSQNAEKCTFGDLNGQKKALLIGDSHSNHFWGFFDVFAQDGHIRMTALSAALCLALPDTYLFDWWSFHNQTFDKCHENTARYYELIAKNHYNYVILGQVWEWYVGGPHVINQPGDERSDALTKERINRAIRLSLNMIVASGARPVIIRTIAPMPINYQKCIRHHVIFRKPYSQKECDNQNPQSQENEWMLPLFAQLQKEYPTLIVIDPKKVQCENNFCVTALDKTPIYRDIGHLNDFAAYQFGQEYLQQFGNPLK
ncbi:acyltransferase, partial [Rahnella sp. BCC 1045]|uniref:acyltransferase family protein n=1 Tax=Rahnella sp. BCC 1045 TaxID=2816251 RepID=UPI001C259D89